MKEKSALVNARFSVGATYCFSTYATLFFVNGMGWMGENSALALGCAQVCLAGLFMIGAFEAMKTSPAANITLIFAFCFGVWGGTSNILTGLGVLLDPAVLGWMNLIAGGMLFLTLPAYRFDPWTSFVVEALAAGGVFFTGLSGVGVAPEVTGMAATIMFGFLGALGFYCFTCDFNNTVAGDHLPAGKPLFKRRVQPAIRENDAA